MSDLCPRCETYRLSDFVELDKCVHCRTCPKCHNDYVCANVYYHIPEIPAHGQHKQYYKDGEMWMMTDDGTTFPIEGEAVKLLKEMEWADGGVGDYVGSGFDYKCFFCENTKRDGHKDDCRWKMVVG